MDLQLIRHVLKIEGSIPNRYAGFLQNKSINLISQRHMWYIYCQVLTPSPSSPSQGIGWGYWDS